MDALLLDSDIVIEVLRSRDAPLARRWKSLAASETLLLYSPVTAAEVWHGCRPSEAASTAGILDALTCVPIDGAIGRKAGEYLRQYHRSHGLQIGDALIAATASIHGVPLWTRNVKHYPMRDLRMA